jgi:hypothetical protein
MNIKFLWSRTQNISFNDRIHFGIMGQMLIGLEKKKIISKSGYELLYSKIGKKRLQR